MGGRGGVEGFLGVMGGQVLALVDCRSSSYISARGNIHGPLSSRRLKIEREQCQQGKARRTRWVGGDLARRRAHLAGERDTSQTRLALARMRHLNHENRGLLIGFETDYLYATASG